MLHLVKGSVAAAAASLALGAVQLAAGHDLTSPLQLALSGGFQNGVNRADKADRGAVAVPTNPTRTISFTPRDLADTSVLVRIPLTQEARDSARAPIVIKPASAKPLVACEPVVSVLTEVAKKLQPGRCLA